MNFKEGLERGEGLEEVANESYKKGCVRTKCLESIPNFFYENFS